MKTLLRILVCLLLSLNLAPAARETREIVMTVNGIKIPILII